MLDWKPPFAKWFVGGQLNASYNCVDRHCEGPHKNKAAIIWEGEPGDRRVLRYQDLQREVSQVRQRPQGPGREEGRRRRDLHADDPRAGRSRMLACARIGAPHTVVFGGFSAEALAGRIQDCKAKVLVTADGGYRRGKVVPLKENADGAAAALPDARERRRLSADRPRRSTMIARPRPLVARPDGQRLGRLPRRAARQRASALHPLHLGLDRQAQGDPPHDRRLPARHDA